MSIIQQVTAPESARGGQSVNIMVRAGVAEGAEGRFLSIGGKVMGTASLNPTPAYQWCDPGTSVEFSMTSFAMPHHDATVVLVLQGYATEGWVEEDRTLYAITFDPSPAVVGGRNG